jgi:hypothetical protein
VVDTFGEIRSMEIVQRGYVNDVVMHFILHIRPALNKTIAMGRRKTCVRTFGALVICVWLSACDSHSSVNASVRVDDVSSHSKTIGLVLANFDLMMQQSNDGKTECPDGPVHTNRENWLAQFSTHAARQRQLNRCGNSQNRGPNCENVWFTPDSIADPLPFREGKGKVAYGINLDGTQDGRETRTTCPHEKFFSPDGERGVDNQYYRFFACHTIDLNGFSKERIRRGIRELLIYRVLLEIRGVDNGQNDNSVEVAIYRSDDPIVVDNVGKAVPWGSLRTSGGPMYRLRGQLVDGLLVTEPADVRWEGEVAGEREQLIRGMTLHLRLTPTGAEGIRAGYIDVDQEWQSYSHQMGATGGIFGASGPAAYSALHRLADGYKDPQTGACTALSSARKYEFVRAYLIHSPKELTP